MASPTVAISCACLVRGHHLRTKTSLRKVVKTGASSLLPCKILRCNTLQWQGMQLRPKNHWPNTILTACVSVGKVCIIVNSFNAQCNLESYELSHVHCPSTYTYHQSCHYIWTFAWLYFMVNISRFISIYQLYLLRSVWLKFVTLSEVPLGHGFTAAGFLHPNEVGHNSMQIPENLGFGATPYALKASGLQSVFS